MTKLDLKKQDKLLYAPKAGEISVVEVPAMNFLMVDGTGDPNHSPHYRDAVAALFSVSYTLKFMVKKGAQQLDYGVLPLEGLWWADDLTKFDTADRSHWRWTMMIRQPTFITPELAHLATEQTRRKKELATLEQVRFETFTEGKAAQLLHVGPFSEEGPRIQQLHDFITGCGKLRGQHHEIYLSDNTKAAPQNWKTILRQPMG